MDGQQGPGCHTWSPPSSSPYWGGVSQGQVPGEGMGRRDPFLPRQQKVAHSGGRSVDLLSQAPQPYLRFESWKDIDSGSEDVCLSRAGPVLFHHLVHSTNLLSTDWAQTQMADKTHQHPKTLCPGNSFSCFMQRNEHAPRPRRCS